MSGSREMWRLVFSEELKVYLFTLFKDDTTYSFEISLTLDGNKIVKDYKILSACKQNSYNFKHITSKSGKVEMVGWTESMSQRSADNVFQEIWTKHILNKKFEGEFCNY